MAASLSTTKVAGLLGVAVRSVAKWIDQGELKAGRTPGGHRRIEGRDLVEFLKRHGLPVPPELQPPSAPRVLIVDDDEAVARWLAEEVQSAHHDWEVGSAHDGFTAGELVGVWRPDMVILDLHMPGVDGFEVCRRIKARAETRETTVIAVTAYPTAEAKERILACGARAFLSKPLDRDLLLGELEAALREVRRPIPSLAPLGQGPSRRTGDCGSGPRP